MGFCFKHLLTQLGRSPNLIFCLEISAWFCVHHKFLPQLARGPKIDTKRRCKDLQFPQVLHQLRHGPENLEVDPYGRRGEPGTWSAFGLKQSSCQPDGDELRMLPAGKSAGQHLWVMQKMPIRGTCEGNRRGNTPWTGLVKPIMNYRMTTGPSYSTLILAKWSVAKCSLSSWPSVNLSYFRCKDEGDLFSRCFEHEAHASHITQKSQWCKFVTAVLTNFGTSHSHYSYQPQRNQVQERGPSYLSCLQKLDLTCGVKAESNMA